MVNRLSTYSCRDDRRRSAGRHALRTPHRANICSDSHGQVRELPVGPVDRSPSVDWGLMPCCFWLVSFCRRMQRAWNFWHFAGTLLQRFLSCDIRVMRSRSKQPTNLIKKVSILVSYERFFKYLPNQLTKFVQTGFLYKTTIGCIFIRSIACFILSTSRTTYHQALISRIRSFWANCKRFDFAHTARLSCKS